MQTHPHTLIHTQTCLCSFSYQGCVNTHRFMFTRIYFTHLCCKWGGGNAARICDPPKVTLNKIYLRGAQRQVLRCPPLGSYYAAAGCTNQHGAGIFSLMSGWCTIGHPLCMDGLTQALTCVQCCFHSSPPSWVMTEEQSAHLPGRRVELSRTVEEHEWAGETHLRFSHPAHQQLFPWRSIAVPLG